MAKIGKEEAQIGTYHCSARAASWSGGLRIACVDAAAVRKSNGQILSAKRRGRLNYRGTKMNVRFRGGLYVSLKGGAKPTQSKGICGGARSYPKRGTKGRRRLNRRAVQINGKFPCNDCYLGIGVWGAQCDCKQFMIHKNQQLFKGIKFPGGNLVKGKPRKVWKPKKVSAGRLRQAQAACKRAFFRTPIGRLANRFHKLRLTVNRFIKGCAADKMAGFHPKKTGNKGRIVANVCRSARNMVNRRRNTHLCKIVKTCGLKSHKCGVRAPADRVKYTGAFGGRGGRPVHSYCRKGRFINYWRIRSGALVDNIRGRCSDGKWLKPCGGGGGGVWQGGLNRERIGVRTGALVDKFNHRGGNGGRHHVLHCGRGWAISGYRLRCGALVDRVQLQCKFGHVWRGMIGPKRTKPRRAKANRRFANPVRLLSRRKPTRQVNTGWGGHSKRAVDGNTNGRYGSRSCTHTHRRRGAWWKVTLGRHYAIHRVLVWNRVDCCQSRLNNIQVLAGHRVCGNVGRARRVNTVHCRWKKANSVTVRHYGPSRYLTLCEVQVFGKHTSPKRKAIKVAKKMANRRHSHRSRKSSSRVRSTCACTNDIHCKPFLGNWFDIHHARAFLMAKIGVEEIQMGLYHCRRAARWSGGLKIACMKGIAIKQSNGRKVDKYVRSHHRYNGKKLGARLTPGGAFVYLRGGARPQQSKGVCGGPKEYKPKAKRGNRRMIGGVKAGGKFPCADCYTGIGVWGAQCDCKQYVLSRNAQIFRKKFPGPVGKPMKKAKPVKNARNKAADIKKQTEKCWRAFSRTPIGKMVMRHKKLKTTAWRMARGCALDHIAGFKPKKKGVKNRNRMIANTCREARNQIRPKKPDPYLCRVVAKCGLKSKACDVKPKRAFKWTKHAGGRGGRPMSALCKKGTRINYWKVRTGRLVDSIQGRCSDGRWLKKCGGRGGKEHRLRTSTQKIRIRSGALLDKFENRGGGGGGRRDLDCGRGYSIAGYKARCGALVDRLQLYCQFGKTWRGMPIKKSPKRSKSSRKRRKHPKPVKARPRRVKLRPDRVKFAAPRRRRARKAAKPAGEGGNKRGKRVLGDEKQVEKKGNQRRHRARKGAGRGNPKGCKVTKAWANSHLKWCPWSGWSGWK